MERLGLGPEVCAGRNPRLVYGRMTGWGQTGPLARSAGHDNNYIAVSGALYYTGTPDEPPSAAITVTGDVGGGALYLAVGLLAGIMISTYRYKDGEFVTLGALEPQFYALMLEKLGLAEDPEFTQQWDRKWTNCKQSPRPQSPLLRTAAPGCSTLPMS